MFSRKSNKTKLDVCSSKKLNHKLFVEEIFSVITYIKDAGFLSAGKSYK